MIEIGQWFYTYKGVVYGNQVTHLHDRINNKQIINDSNIQEKR